MNEVDQLFLRTSSLSSLTSIHEKQFSCWKYTISLVSQCPTKIIIIESFLLALPFSPVGLRNHGADNRELVDHGLLFVVLIGLNQDLRHLHRCEVCLFQACDVLLQCCSLGTLPLVLSVAKSQSVQLDLEEMKDDANDVATLH